MSPLKVILLSLILLLALSLSTSLIGLKSPWLILNENQIFYLYSTSSQVLAAIYGLTLTGFIFFRNELSREEFEDDTLTAAVENLKSRYFKVLIFVTILSVYTLLVSNLVLASESDKGRLFNTIVMNSAQSSFFINLVVIAYFIFDVIAPKRVERESRNIQTRVDPRSLDYAKGSLEQFLKNYNSLEMILQKYGAAYQSEFEGERRPRRRISNIRLAEFILRAEKIDSDLFNEIKDLITLRNSIIHGADPVVSKRLVEISEDVLRKLASALQVGI